MSGFQEIKSKQKSHLKKSNIQVKYKTEQKQNICKRVCSTFC